MTDQQFTDVEQWLADRGIERQPIEVAADEDQASGPEPDPGQVDEDAPTGDPGPLTEGGHGPSPSARESARLASTPPPQPPGGDQLPGGAQPSAMPGRLEDELSRAMGFVRRSVAGNPSSEGRLRDKLRRRDTAPAVIDAAIQQARRERLVDDEAMATSLANEWLERGHAPFRVRGDLRKRGFPDGLIDEVLASTVKEDPEARAFGVARDAASRYQDLDPDTQYRRLVAYLARRGHHEGLAGKVAREVVFVEREQERTSSR